MLQRVAVCCSVLQCVAVRASERESFEMRDLNMYFGPFVHSYRWRFLPISSLYLILFSGSNFLHRPPIFEEKIHVRKRVHTHPQRCVYTRKKDFFSKSPTATFCLLPSSNRRSSKTNEFLFVSLPRPAIHHSLTT